MASSSNTYGFDLSSSNTTFIQADPSTFLAVVQKLTGAPNDPSGGQKLPLTLPTGPVSGKGSKRPGSKLHERRQNSKKLELELNRGVMKSEVMMKSPVSTLEFLAFVSPSTPVCPPCDEEERAIAEKKFYLHSSPISAPRKGSGADPPKLLPLFPLRSPSANISQNYFS